MLKENCKEGMKVTTTGRTARERARESSACCKGEEKVGYVTLGHDYGDKIEVHHKNYITEFKYNQIHPYWGDK